MRVDLPVPSSALAVGAHPDDIEAYMDGKDAFIRETDALAAAWRRRMP